MITKKEIIEVLLDYGLSPIESERVTDNKENFSLAIQGLMENWKQEVRVSKSSMTCGFGK